MSERKKDGPSRRFKLSYPDFMDRLDPKRGVSGETFRENLLAVCWRRGVWPSGEKIDPEDFQRLHRELHDAFTCDDFNRAQAAAAPFGFSMLQVQHEWTRDHSRTIPL